MPVHYMLDTQVIIRLAEQPNEIVAFTKASENGSKFFITSVQEDELFGKSYKNGGTKNIKQIPKEEARKRREILNMLSVKCVPAIATWTKDTLRGDGSHRLVGKSPPPYMPGSQFTHGESPNKIADRLIAEAVIHHGLVLVSDDEDLVKHMQRDFPDNAIHYNDFIRAF